MLFFGILHSDAYIFPFLLCFSFPLLASLLFTAICKPSPESRFAFLHFFSMEATYNIVLVLPYINMNPPQVYTCSPSWTPLPTSSSCHPSSSSQCTSPNILYHTSNLDWRFISYMILYLFQCHSPKSSHPLSLPQSPKDCSIHLCLFCYLAYRVIVTIFLNPIYMR